MASPLGSPLLSPSVSFTPRIAVFKFCSSVFLISLTSLINPLFESPIAFLLASIWAICSAVIPVPLPLGAFTHASAVPVLFTANNLFASVVE